MSGNLLHLLNHLLAVALEEQRGDLPIHVESVELSGEACTVTGHVAAHSSHGRFRLHVEPEPPQGTRQTVRLRLSEWPERLPEPLAPFRALLTGATLRVELTYPTEPTATAAVEPD